MLQIFRDWTKRYFSDPQMIILGLMLILGFATVFLLGEILMPVFASIVSACLLEGMAAYLQRWKIPRLVAVIIVFISFIAGMFVLIIWLFPLLSRQISQLLSFFGGLWGVWGVFFAIPLATLINTVIKKWLLRSATGTTGGTDSREL